MRPRFAMPLVTVFTLVVLAACGGGDEAQPLTLSQRVVQAEDAPGSKPDPVEKGQMTADFDEFIPALSELAVDPDKETMTAVFRGAGFQAAIADARFFGEKHFPELPHVFSAAIQLESADGAGKAPRLVIRGLAEAVPEVMRRPNQRVRRERDSGCPGCPSQADG